MSKKYGKQNILIVMSREQADTHDIVAKVDWKYLNNLSVFDDVEDWKLLIEELKQYVNVKNVEITIEEVNQKEKYGK